MELIVQVNGKLRGRVQLPAGRRARAGAWTRRWPIRTVQRFIAGKAVRRAMHVPDKLVNLVV